MIRHTIAADGISATVLAHGAELCSWRGPDGRELMWQAGPAWPRHAPVLFPIVGRLRDDRLMHGGQDFRLTQHGFARDRNFTFAETAPTRCRLALRDDAATRALFPFPFLLEITFCIADGALDVAYRATNSGAATLPVSMGAHPAFRWPLADGIAKTDHILTFEADEVAPMPRVIGGLLGPAVHASPIRDRVLALDEALFAEDALILPEPASRWVRYSAPGVAGIEMRWRGFSAFGIWMRQGAEFLCLEPWSGMASPAEWDGVIEAKPGMTLLEPGACLEAGYSLRTVAA